MNSFAPTTLQDTLADAAIAPIAVRYLGVCDYAETREKMRVFTESRDADTADEIWILEHPPVYTLGQAGRIEHLLRATDIPLVHTERGGQITYHAPGQVVAYVLIDIKRRGVMVREFVHRLESALIETLAAYNLLGQRKPGAPGIYVLSEGELAKIAALGLKIRNGSTFHGVSLNVAMNLEPFGWINPCGYEGLKTVDMATMGAKVAPLAVARTLADKLVGEISKKENS